MREMDAGQMLFSVSVKNLTELQAVKRCFAPPLNSEIRRKGAACVYPVQSLTEARSSSPHTNGTQPQCEGLFAQELHGSSRTPCFLKCCRCFSVKSAKDCRLSLSSLLSPNNMICLLLCKE